jgi:hypothetical protein
MSGKKSKATAFIFSFCKILPKSHQMGTAAEPQLLKLALYILRGILMVMGGTQVGWMS